MSENREKLFVPSNQQSRSEGCPAMLGGNVNNLVGHSNHRRQLTQNVSITSHLCVCVCVCLSVTMVKDAGKIQYGI